MTIYIYIYIVGLIKKEAVLKKGYSYGAIYKGMRRHERKKKNSEQNDHRDHQHFLLLHAPPVPVYTNENPYDYHAREMRKRLGLVSGELGPTLGAVPKIAREKREQKRDR